MVRRRALRGDDAGRHRGGGSRPPRAGWPDRPFCLAVAGHAACRSRRRVLSRHRRGRRAGRSGTNRRSDRSIVARAGRRMRAGVRRRRQCCRRPRRTHRPQVVGRSARGCCPALLLLGGLPRLPAAQGRGSTPHGSPAPDRRGDVRGRRRWTRDVVERRPRADSRMPARTCARPPDRGGRAGSGGRCVAARHPRRVIEPKRAGRERGAAVPEGNPHARGPRCPGDRRPLTALA